MAPDQQLPLLRPHDVSSAAVFPLSCISHVCAVLWSPASSPSRMKVILVAGHLEASRQRGGEHVAAGGPAPLRALNRPLLFFKQKLCLWLSGVLHSGGQKALHASCFLAARTGLVPAVPGDRRAGSALVGRLSHRRRDEGVAEGGQHRNIRGFFKQLTSFLKSRLQALSSCDPARLAVFRIVPAGCRFTL
ncbi:hypothetical protein CB1_001792001 [Camelus ferus]|nr:hypothetical protein CB1_001792001 [Camelus ferus]